MTGKYGPAGIASIAIASNGSPHILYSDWQFRDDGYSSHLKHAYWDGQDWQIELVDQHGFFHALVLDDQDRPHISYYGGEYSDPDVLYGFKDAGTWHIEYVADGFPSSTDIVLDQQQRPHIVYHDDYDQLKYGYKDGDAWLTETINSETRGSVSLAIDAGDHPMIAYSNYFSLYFARKDSDEWISDLIGEGPSQDGSFPSLALDEKQEPRILFLNQDYSLHLAQSEEGNWPSETVAIGGSTGNSPVHDTAVDGAGNLHALYYDRLQKRLYYAVSNAEAWVTEVITQVNIGIYSDFAASLDLDSQDRPHIIFKAGSDEEDLVYTHNSGADWTFEVLDQLRGDTISIAVDSQSRPHVAYSGEGGLHYTLKTGSEWSTPVLASGCNHIDLKLDSLDSPHIACGDPQGLRYMQWMDDGLSEQQLDQGESVEDVSIALDTLDRPHIFYSFSWYVKYAYSDGEDWQIEAVTSEGMAYPHYGSDNSIVLDQDNKPHLAWCKYSEGVSYAQLIQGNWQAEIADNRRCSTSDVRSTSIVLDKDGLPLIGYHLTLEGDLMLASCPVLDKHVYLPVTQKG